MQRLLLLSYRAWHDMVMKQNTKPVIHISTPHIISCVLLPLFFSSGLECDVIFLSWRRSGRANYTGEQKLESEPLEYEDPNSDGVAMTPMGQEDSGSSEVTGTCQQQSK